MKTLLLFTVSLCCLAKVKAQHPVDSSWSIEIGGIRQWISAKGKSVHNPILLWLNGGPGSPSVGKADKYTRKLENHFIVIQWDQRETGKTAELSKSVKPLTLQLFYNDTHDLIDSLLVRFQQKKLFLVGYSWGTVLGFYIAGKYPELLHTYVAISPMVNQQQSELMTLQMLKEKARTKKEKEELALVTIPFMTGEQIYYARKWLAVYNGNGIAKLLMSKKYVINWAHKWLSVFNEASAVNTPLILPEIKCPVYFFVGKNDYQTQHILAADYYEQLKAPRKDLFWFEESGHTLADTETELMQRLIIEKILPQIMLVQ